MVKSAYRNRNQLHGKLLKMILFNEWQWMKGFDADFLENENFLQNSLHK